jgi:hypothetical protein
MANMTSTDDPFEEFEVESGSEKEFLIANLKNDAPKDEVEQFREARKPLSAEYSSSAQQWDTTMNQEDFEETVRTAWVSDRDFGSQDWQEFKFLQSATPAEIDARIYELILREQDENSQTPLPSLEYPAPYLVLQKKVEEFARSHMFTVNKHMKPTTLQRREFTRDIYDYARAIGMGRYQANIEVMRARAAYRYNRGLAGSLKLDESDDESTLGLEINDAAEYITSMTSGMQHGPVDPAGAWDEITRLKAKISHSDARARKRKRDTWDNHTASEGVLAAGRLGDGEDSRASKKHKRRKLKKRHCIGNSHEPAELAVTPPISKRRKERRKAKRQKRAILSKLEGSMDIKSEAKSHTKITSKLSPIAHSNPEHISKASGGPRHNETVSTENGTAIGLMPKEKLKVESFIANSNKVQDDAGDDSWDLRQKEKKKRKRKIVDGSGNNANSLNIKTKAKPTNENMNVNPIRTGKAPLNRDHFEEDGLMTAGHEKERVKSDTADDSGEVIPLSELISINSNKKMQGRRDRGKRKKAVTGTPKASTSEAIEAAKDYHS